MSQEEDEFSYDGYLLYNQICEVKNPSDPAFTDTPSTAENHLLEEYLPAFEEGNSQDEGEGFEKTGIRNYTSKLPESTREFVDSLISLRYLEEDFETEEEAEVSPDEPRQPVKIPNKQSADIFWMAPNHLMVRGAESDAESAKEELNAYLGQAAHVHNPSLSQDFLLWLFEKIYEDEALSEKIYVEKLTDAKVEGAEDVLGMENTVKESSNAREAPTLLIGLLLGKSLTMMEGNIVLATSDEDSDNKTLRVQIERDKIQIKSSKAGLGNADPVEKIGYSAEVTHEIMRLYEEWKELTDTEKVVPPTFLEKLLKKSHENDIPIEDRSTILSVFRQYANRRGDDLTDYDIEEALELLKPDQAEGGQSGDERDESSA